jgi:hypothetical protein
MHRLRFAMSLSCDDLRTRSEAGELPRGSAGAERLVSAGRTAQMITPPQGKLGVCA